MKERVSEKLNRVLLVGFYVLTLMTAGVCLTVGVVGTRAFTGFRLVLFLGMLLLAGVACYLCIRYGEYLTNGKLVCAAVICFAILLFLQVRVAITLVQEPAWDPGGVYLSASEWVYRGGIVTHEHYLDRFPNNNGLFVIEVIFFKIMKFFEMSASMFSASIMNIVFTDVGILFMMLFVRKVWGNARALLYLMISLCFLPYIIYMPVVYTDTMSLPFVTFPLYLFAHWQSQKNQKIRVALLIGISLTLSIGMKVKGNVAILLIAMIVYLICKYNWKQWIAAILILIVPFFLLSQGFDYAMKSYGVVTGDAEIYEFPGEYWIYMGLQSPGGFNMEDFSYIYEYPDYQTKKEAAVQGIQQRLSDYGVTGLTKHLYEKAKYTFGEGTYFAGVKVAKGAISKDNRWYNYFAVDGEKNSTYYAYENAMQAMILLLLLAGMIRGLWKKSFDMITLLYIAFFGMSIFLMIWETRSRYLVNFTPIMLVLAIDSLIELGTWLRGRLLPIATLLSVD